jgi:hypothetical protein
MTNYPGNNDVNAARSRVLEVYKDRRSARIFCIYFGIFSIFLLLLGIFFAAYFREAHTLNRAGGSLTALSLLVIVYQFNFERRRKNDEAILRRRADLLANPRPYDRSTLAKIESEIRKKIEELEDVRYFILLTSVSVGFLGEITHAWGDLLLYSILPNSFNKGH